MSLAELELPTLAASADEGLPEGWTLTRLRDNLVTNLQPGFACGTNNRDCGGIAHLRPMNVDREGRIDLANVKYVPASEATRDERWLNEGDVLFNNTNSAELVGKTAYYSEAEPRLFSNHMTRLRCNPKVLDSHFCAMALHQKWREGYFAARCNNHVSQASIGANVLLDTDLFLPPLAEQRRIIAKAEQLLAATNTTRARLARVPTLLKRFRQAVLAAACSGRLTADWREANPDVEPAAHLLERILAERRAKWEAEQTTKKHGQSKASTSDPFRVKEGVNPAVTLSLDLAGSEVEPLFRKQKASGQTKYQEPAAPDTSELPELPEEWCWASLSALTSQIGDVDHKMPKAAIDGIPYISTKDFYSQDEINYERAKKISQEDYAALCRKIYPQQGDILISRYGTVGEVRTVRSDEPFQVSYSVAIVKLLPLTKQGQFLATAMRSEIVQAQIRRDTRSTAQPDLGLEHIRQFALPLPPLTEQQEIVQRVERLFRLAEAIGKRTAAAALRADRLTQSILAKAFRGELVPTEAELARAEGRDYEPATALLERTRAEQTQANRGKPKP